MRQALLFPPKAGERKREEEKDQGRDVDKQMRAFHCWCSTFKSLMALLIHAGKLFSAADLSYSTTTQT